jgi:hypothetical protein
MSYDLEARGNGSFSVMAARADIHNIIAQIEDVNPNGRAGFVLERGEDTYMEIDVEYVSEEGDNIEEADNLSQQVNCISFHIPYGLADNLASCIETAIEVSQKIGWQLYDCQYDKIITDLTDVPELQPKKPWWKFW